MLGQKDDLSDMFSIMDELAVERLHHQVLPAADVERTGPRRSARPKKGAAEAGTTRLSKNEQARRRQTMTNFGFSVVFVALLAAVLTWIR